MMIQRIRERLTGDFATIKSLCPDPRLISDSCQPNMLGACKGIYRSVEILHATPQY